MSEELEPTGKKRRVIHWNPEAGREQSARRWTIKRVLIWTVGGFVGLVAAAAIVVRGTKAILGPDVFTPRAEMAATGVEPAADANTLFVTQTNAEQAYEIASKGVADLRRMPNDHPVLLDRLVLLDKGLSDSQRLIRSREYGRAYAALETLNRDINEFSQDVKFRTEARQAYDKVLSRARELELGSALAPGSLEAARESAGIGRQMLNEGNFTGAKASFAQAEAELKKTETALNDFIGQNLLAGQRAIAKGEKAEAKAAFQAVLEKSPGNERAIAGLKRAENSDRVYALLLQGGKFEQQKQFAEAADSFQKAFALDAESAEAQQGAARAARLQKETDYATAQTAAEAAFKRREWDVAIAQAEAALKVDARKTEMQTLLRSARENAHKDAVQKALNTAYAHENERRWTDALAAYRTTLELEPDHTDAKEGIIRCSTVVRALLQYERLIDEAERLANKAEFQTAYRRFQDAMNSKPVYLQPSDRVIQLRTLLTQQTQPVNVTFKSDGKTWVQITNFKQPWKLETESVKMYPGDYRVEGRRQGYATVEYLVQIRNGTTPPVVSVVCVDNTKR